MSAISSAVVGIDRAFNSLDATAKALANVGVFSAPGADMDSVDLSTAMVSLINARNSVAVGVKVVHTADDMLKSTLSLLA